MADNFLFYPGAFKNVYFHHGIISFRARPTIPVKVERNGHTFEAFRCPKRMKFFCFCAVENDYNKKLFQRNEVDPLNSHTDEIPCPPCPEYTITFPCMFGGRK